MPWQRSNNNKKSSRQKATGLPELSSELTPGWYCCQPPKTALDLSKKWRNWEATDSRKFTYMLRETFMVN